MKEKMYGPGEWVYQNGEKDNRVYFIIKGELELILSQEKGSELETRGERGQSQGLKVYRKMF
jgi:CRP-like cAMP-binding protein